jgi:aminobenzoyl-glutamate utilization protein B
MTMRSKMVLRFYLIPIFVFVFFCRPVFSQGLTPAMQATTSWIEQNKATYDEIAKFIWDNPELSLVEFKSSAKLMDYLAKNGFKIEKGMSGMPTAFVATYGSGKPVIGFLAEYDALPSLSQESGVTTAKPIIAGAPGHGCGHNLYGTSSATAAIAAAQAMQKQGIKGTIKVFGTPAEETLVGKVFMNRDGVFDGTDVIITWHPGDENRVEYQSLLAFMSIKFQFHGRSAHAAAAPEHGRSALDAVMLMNLGMEFMREHLIQEARIHYVNPKGGETPNNVPPFAETYYFIRSPRWAQVEHIWKWMQNVAKGAALMTETKMTYQILTVTYERLPNRTLAKMGDEMMKLVGAPSFTPEDQKFGAAVIQSLGKEWKEEPYSTKIVTPNFAATFPNVPVTKASNDQGNLSWRIPILGFGAATEAKFTPGHSWQVVCQEKTEPGLKAGLQVSKWMAVSALKLMTDPEIIQAAWAEHGKYLADLGAYKEPLPQDVKVPTFEMLYGMKPENVPGAKK